MSLPTISNVQHYAQKFTVKTLSRVSGAKLKLVLKYQGKDEIITLGEVNQESDQTEAVVVVKSPSAWVKICSGFDLGFSEAYMLQEVDCDNLSRLFDIYINNRRSLGSGNLLLQLVPRLLRFFQPRNNVERARLNASSHYDTSNQLFSAFLSKDMNYSCAHWSGDPSESLESAQQTKVMNLLKKLKLSSTHHLLEIGCGWGDVAIKAVQTTGCRVTGLTLAMEQKVLADQRIKDAGLQERVEILLCDYRNAPLPEGGYDRIISIGMFEHVGSEYMNQYFKTISTLLNPDTGLMVIDGITMTSNLHDNKASLDTFIDRYVFPGGYLPTINILLESLQKGSGGSLEVISVQDIGPHYGKTLLAWRDNFLRNWEVIKSDFIAHQTDASNADVEAFRRKWLYYFLYCESGFRARILGNYIISAARTPQPTLSYDDPAFGDMI